MKRERAEALPTLLALFKLAHMPRNGYVFLRFKAHVNGKGIRTKHIMCWYHFACWMFYHYTLRGLGYSTKHWAGNTDVDVLLHVVKEAIEADKFQIMRVSEYDGRYRSDCYYCGGRTKKGRGRAMCGAVPYTNGPTHG